MSISPLAYHRLPRIVRAIAAGSSRLLYLRRLGNSSQLEIRCLGGDGLLVPESCLCLPGALERITDGLASTLK